jgi:hypothetical protein
MESGWFYRIIYWSWFLSLSVRDWKPYLPGFTTLSFNISRNRTEARKLGFTTKPVNLAWHSKQTHEASENALSSDALRRWDMQHSKMQGIQGYQWSRCNVARGSVSCMVASRYVLEGGFDLKVPLGFPYQNWRCTHYLTTSDSFFLKGRFFPDLHCFIRGKLRIAPLKRACV